MSLRTSKFTESQSVKNRLSESLEDIDYLSEEDVSVFGEEDIILVEYEDTHKTTLKKGNKSRRKVQGHKQKNSADDLDTDDDLKVPEAIVIDFDTPTRKLVMKSRVDLKRINLQMEELSRESRRTNLKLKQKRKLAREEEEDVDEEDDDDEVSPSLADLMAKRSNLSRRLADQRKKSHKRLRS